MDKQKHLKVRKSFFKDLRQDCLQSEVCLQRPITHSILPPPNFFSLSLVMCSFVLLRRLEG